MIWLLVVVGMEAEMGNKPL